MPYNRNSPQIRERQLAKHFPIVRRFNEMPDDALVSPAVIACLEDCSLPTFYRRVAAGLLPAPNRIGGTSRVRVGDYRRMRAAREALKDRAR
jgi:predicted DNA-binding transcriptional regulator AlpA